MKRVYRYLTSFIFLGVVLVFSAHSAHATQASTTSGQQTASLQFSQIPPVTNSGPPLLNYVRIDLSTDQTQGLDVFDATMDTTTVSPSVIFGYSDLDLNLDGTFAKVLKWDKGYTTEIQNLRLDGYPLQYELVPTTIIPLLLDLDGSIFGRYDDLPEGTTVTFGRFEAVNGVASWLTYPQFEHVEIGEYGSYLWNANDASGSYAYLNETRINGQIYLFRQEDSGGPDHPIIPVHDVFYPSGHYLNGVIGGRPISPLSGLFQGPYYYSFWNGSQFMDFDQNLIMHSWNNAGHILGTTRDDNRAFLYYDNNVFYISELIPLQYRDKLSSLRPTGITNPNPDNQNSFFIYFDADLNQGTVAQPVIIRGRFRLQVPPIGSSSMIGKLVQRNDADVISRGFSGDSSYSFHDRYNVLSDTFYATSGYGDYGAILDLGGDQFDAAGNPIPYNSHAHVYLSVPAELAVDANRDGTITLASENTGPASSDTTTKDKPFRFWINDDDDAGDTNGSDIPNPSNSSNGAGTTNFDGDGVVDGARDLVDFFPVFLDIKQLLAVLPPNAAVKYKLKQADSALNFVYTKLSRMDALKYQKENRGAIYGPMLNQLVTSAGTRRISAVGVELSNQFLMGIKDQDWGVILVEGWIPTTKPLVLSVEKSDGTVVAKVKLELSIGGVEQMFRSKNLNDGPDAPADSMVADGAGLVGTRVSNALATNIGDPAGFPDASCSNHDWLIFVHGFNVTGQASRGWNAEMFKRFYWSGSHARFAAVSWFGSPDKPDSGLSGTLGLPSDYYKSVRNAFTTAPLLARFVNGLPGGKKTTVSHSLGCGVVASAIADYDMQVAHACFVDAALAREAFDGEAANLIPGMVPSAWQNYPTALWAANWHRLFWSNGAPSKDARSILTWRNRFTTYATNDASGVIHNFYSSTEDVLARYDEDPPTNLLDAANAVSPGGIHSWVISEKTKGNLQHYGFYIYSLQTVGTTYNGWGFNLNDPLVSNLPTWYVPNPERQQRRVKTPTEIGTLTATLSNGARYNPLFKSGWGYYDTADLARVLIDSSPTVNDGPTWILDLYGVMSGNTIASDASKRAQLLAEAIPALSLPVGANSTTIFQNHNYDMPTLFADNWPSIRGSDPITSVPSWHHSDLREVAYIYQHRFFEKLVEVSKQ